VSNAPSSTFNTVAKPAKRKKWDGGLSADTPPVDHAENMRGLARGDKPRRLMVIPKLVDTGEDDFVRKAALEDLARSGLDERDAINMNIVADPTGYTIYYSDVNGRLTGFWRQRLRTERQRKTKNGAHDGWIRYLQAKGSDPHIYFPRNRDWARITKDPKYTIIVVEGEKKSFRLSKEKDEDFNALGIGGVWNYQSKKNGQLLIPELDQVDWLGRLVIIIFDADRAINADVAEAERRLVNLLVMRGAIVRVVRLTPSLDGKNRGADDFIEQEGGPALRKLIDVAIAEEPTKAERLVSGYAIITKPSCVAELATGALFFWSTFRAPVGLQFCDTVLGKDGLPKVVDNITLWGASPGARRFAGLAFKPGVTQNMVMMRPTSAPKLDPVSYFNSWRGWPAEPRRDNALFGIFERLIEHLFPVPKQREYLFNLIAYKRQHPETKLPITPILYTPAGGTGKTLLGNLIGTMFKPYSIEIPGRELLSSFNEWAAKRLLVVVNELGLQDKREAADIIKMLLSDHAVTVNEKYGPK